MNDNSADSRFCSGRNNSDRNALMSFQIVQFHRNGTFYYFFSKLLPNDNNLDD